jgi:hypothetical protein
MTSKSHRMQKHKFIITSPNALFVEAKLVPPEQEKQYVDVSHPGRTRMHYVTHRSHRMQKHMLGVTCLDMVFVESVQVPTVHEK